MTTLEERIERDRITATVESAYAPGWASDDRPARDWYRVTLQMDGRRMTVPFGMGPALRREPDVGDVLECLLSDASGIENTRGFEDWASDYGLDTDSRRAERDYGLVQDQTVDLRAFLGDKYDAYLWDTEPA